MTYRPRGNNHWTRRRPDLLPSWKKLKPPQRAALVLRFLDGESPVTLATTYRIGRTTVWRYLRSYGLVKTRRVSCVSRGTGGDI